MLNILNELPQTWQTILWQEAEKPYFKKLIEFIAEERKTTTVFPQEAMIFTAFKLTPFNQIKVVILGQDPYHNPNQAHGLAFSVAKEVKVPPSLKNIYKELQTDLQLPTPSHGNLTAWAEQGVLLLNSVLTVRENKPSSHANKGWEQFTDQVITQISEQKEHVVFILWGNYAQKKATLINADNHLIISAPHPSPLSAFQGFWGSKPFSLTNNYLEQNQIAPINWLIPDDRPKLAL